MIAMFFPPAASFLSRAKRALSSRSRSNRTAVLSYSCPLKDLPSPGGFSSVDSHLICLAAMLRGRGDGAESDLRREQRARAETLFGNDIVNDSQLSREVLHEFYQMVIASRNE